MFKRKLYSRLIWAVLLLLALSAIYVIFLIRSNPIKLGTNSIYYGNIVHGSRFGFAVGGKIKSDNVPKHVVFLGTYGCTGTYRALSGCISGRHASFTVDKFAYHGQIFLGLDNNDRIKSIIWNADIFPLEWQ